jgi:hypothetical protein
MFIKTKLGVFVLKVINHLDKFFNELDEFINLSLIKNFIRNS